MSELTLVEIENAPVTLRSAAMSAIIDTITRELARPRVELPRSRQIAADLKGLKGASLKTLDTRVRPIGTSTRDQKTLDAAIQAVAMVQALDRSPELAPLREAVHKELPDARNLARELQDVLRRNETGLLSIRAKEITTMHSGLTNTLRWAHLSMARQEQLGVVRTIETTLTEIGFQQVEIKTHNDGRQILRGSTADASVFAEVGVDGRLRIDTAGFTGRSCEKAVESLLGGLRARGLEVRRKERLVHGKAEGGELTKEAKGMFNPLRSLAGESARREEQTVRRPMRAAVSEKRGRR